VVADPEEHDEEAMRGKRSLRNWIDENLISGYCSLSAHPRVKWERNSDGREYCYIKFEDQLSKQNTQVLLKAAGFEVHFAFWPEGTLAEIQVK